MYFTNSNATSIIQNVLYKSVLFGMQNLSFTEYIKKVV